MADPTDYLGDIPTAQDVLEKIEAQRIVRSKSTPVEKETQHIVNFARFAAEMMGQEFGTPEERKEVATQEAMTKAFSETPRGKAVAETWSAPVDPTKPLPVNPRTGKKEVPKDKYGRKYYGSQKTEGVEEEGALEWQKRQHEVFLREIKDTDPELAMGAVEAIQSIDEEIKQRTRLKTQQAKAEIDLKESQRVAQQKALEGRFKYTMTRKGVTTSHDSSTREGRNSLTKARAAGELLVSEDDILKWDEDKRKAIQAAKRGGGVDTEMNNKQIGEIVEGFEASQNTFFTSATLVEMSSEFPDVFSATATVTQVTKNGLAELAAINRAVGGAGHQSRTLASLDRLWPEYTKMLGTKRAITKSLVVNLAYSLARQIDSSGRLSDEDLRRALEMIGGDNADPAIFAGIQLDRARIAVRKANNQIASLHMIGGWNESISGPRMDKAYEIAMQEYELLIDKIVDSGYVSLEEIEKKTGREGLVAGERQAHVAGFITAVDSVK